MSGPLSPGDPPRHRIGSVPYLNALPLTADLGNEVALLPPSVLAHGMQEEAFDAALVSVTEVLFSERFRALEGYGILSDGPVFSVFLAHRTPLDRLRSVHVDPASCTSVNLLRVLLEARGVRPEFRLLESYEGAGAHDDVLLIGNPAIRFRRTLHDHQIWDLGAAWKELTGLPFVFAFWAIRDGVEAIPLARTLARAAESGLAKIPKLVEASPDFDPDFRRAYLGGHIRYRLDSAARAGLEQFGECLRKTSHRRVHPIRWVPVPPLT